jgi:hypothetical protein
MLHRYPLGDAGGREERFAGLFERPPESRRFSFFDPPSPPSPPSLSPPPRRDDAAIKARKEEERLARKRRMGFGKTILTSGLGDTSKAPVARKTLG